MKRKTSPKVGWLSKEGERDDGRFSVTNGDGHSCFIKYLQRASNSSVRVGSSFHGKSEFQRADFVQEARSELYEILVRGCLDPQVLEP